MSQTEDISPTAGTRANPDRKVHAKLIKSLLRSHGTENLLVFTRPVWKTAAFAATTEVTVLTISAEISLGCVPPAHAIYSGSNSRRM